MADTTFTDTVTLTAATWFQDNNDQVYKNAGVCYLTSPAGTNTVTGTSSPTQTAYKARQVFWFIPANTNTGATTLQVDALGAKNVFCWGVACVGGEIRANVPVGVIYDGTQFNLINPNTPNGTWTPALKFGGASASMTYAVQQGRFTKLSANRVAINGYITLTAKGASTGTATITGLPYTSINTTANYPPLATYPEILDASATGQITAVVNVNATTISIYKYVAGVTVALADTHFGNTSSFAFAGHFEI